ncbi:MAG: hypothetical protein LBI05_09165 [Planctomycetaceae bacterium]|nr:hypothetical protein [Planctomycetaceae bacterium]
MNRLLNAISQQSDDLCVEVRHDSKIIILHLDNGEQEVIKLPSDKFQKIYESLTRIGLSIQKPESIE